MGLSRRKRRAKRKANPKYKAGIANGTYSSIAGSNPTNPSHRVTSRTKHSSQEANCPPEVIGRLGTRSHPEFEVCVFRDSVAKPRERKYWCVLYIHDDLQYWYVAKDRADALRNGAMILDRAIVNAIGEEAAHELAKLAKRTARRNAIPRYARCWVCDGKGVHGADVPCSTCRGTGMDAVLAVRQGQASDCLDQRPKMKKKV